MLLLLLLLLLLLFKYWCWYCLRIPIATVIVIVIVYVLLSPTIETEYGHMRQDIQGLRSIKNQTAATAANISVIDDHLNQVDNYYIQTNNVCYAMFTTTKKALMDLTGRFLYNYIRGNEYILIAYHYDSNVILGLPLKNCQAGTIAKALMELQTTFTKGRVRPHTCILDNKTSHGLQTAMTKYKTIYQFVPPHNHQANIAE